MNVSELRQDFPLFQAQNGKKQVIYLDNACMSLRPRPVIEAVTRYYTDYSACSGRSMHKLAAAVTAEVDEVRTLTAKFIGAAHKEEIIFTRNTTEAINLVAHSLDLKAGDAVLVTGKEHNSNLIPWQMLVKQKGIQLLVLPEGSDGQFDQAIFEQSLTPQVRLVSFGYSSNLDGVTLPAESIIKAAHKKGAWVLLDAAQAAPHRKINVRALDVDFLAFSGHKMLGPSGTGVLYGKAKLLDQLAPFLVGGDTVASSTYDSCEFLPVPERFEAGLQDYAGLFGLGAALQYLSAIGFDAIQKHETLLNQQISEGARDVEGLHLFGPADPARRGGIFTFFIDGIDSHRIALMLDQMANVCVRSGQHCVHSWFNAHHIQGSVRASTYFYNTPEEIDLFLQNLKKIRKVL
ncbi:MAG: cysteine desulfurase [Anaerolineaceae bacterium]|nr:cysteine desulfurase [Anaerolineaceae bacterium]